MANHLKIEDNQNDSSFRLILDGTAISDIFQYSIVAKAGEPTHLILDVAILTEIEVQL